MSQWVGNKPEGVPKKEDAAGSEKEVGGQPAAATVVPPQQGQTQKQGPMIPEPVARFMGLLPVGGGYNGECVLSLFCTLNIDFRKG